MWLMLAAIGRQWPPLAAVWLIYFFVNNMERENTVPNQKKNHVLNKILYIYARTHVFLLICRSFQ